MSQKVCAITKKKNAGIMFPWMSLSLLFSRLVFYLEIYAICKQQECGWLKLVPCEMCRYFFP